MFLYVAPDTDDALIESLFGVPGWAALPPVTEPLILPRLPASRLNTAVHSLITAARERCRAFMRLRVVTAGRPEEPRFTALIIEDKGGGSMG